MDQIEEPAQPRPTRARPLSREDRREAIVIATIPLLERYGAQVSTRQIAAAAGVAEGTLFRAFDDKVELLVTAARRVVDSTRTVEAVEALPDAGSLEGEIVQLAEHLCGMARRFRRVMLAVHGILASEEGQRTHGRFRHGNEGRADGLGRVVHAVAARLSPYADELRVDPADAARLLSAMIMGQGPPGLPSDAEVTAVTVVDVLLHGVAR